MRARVAALKRASSTAVLFLLAAALTLAGPSAPAQAATTPAHHAATRTTHAPVGASVGTTARPTLPSRPVRSATLTQQARRAVSAAAARVALSASVVPDTCSGVIVAETIYPCSTPSTTGTDTFTLTVPAAPETLLIRVLATGSISGNALPITLTAPDSSTVSCQQPTQLYECSLSQAGPYTLAVANDANTYTIDYTTLVADAGCAAMNTSFAAAPVQASTVAGQTGTCYTLNLPTGSVLHSIWQTSPNGITVAVYDATGTKVCAAANSDCTLGGTAPYRVFASANYGDAETYTLAMNNVTAPSGCLAAPQEVYGQVLDTSSADRCRTLTVSTAGTYQVFPMPVLIPAAATTLYAAGGTSACTSFAAYPTCTLAVGTYHYVVDDLPPGDFGMVFMAVSESRGCTPIGDKGFSSGPVTGAFGGTFEEICRTLPNASGQADFFFNQPPGGNSSTSVMQVLDAKGAQQCELDGAGNFGGGSCRLTGTAPFHVILLGGGFVTAYRLLVNRTNSYAGCAIWPRSGFGGSWGATVTLSSPSALKCLLIPAGQHSAGEMIDYSNPANQVDGAIQVSDPAGNLVCTGTSMSACAYKPGVTYTALVSTTAARGDTYHLVRRDISAAAKCAAPRSTVAGGPSTTFTLTSDLDAVCYRVTAAATDRFWFGERTLAPVPPGGVYQGSVPPTGAFLLVTNAAGAQLCRMPIPDGECRVAAAKDYQLIAVAAGYAGVAITTHLDTWRVGGASGWASQCQRHHFSFAAGWAPLSGTLTEAAAGYCAVVDVKPSQAFGIYGTSDAGYPGVPYVNVYTAAEWTTLYNYFGQCGGNNIGTFAYTCSSNTAGQDVLLVTPYSTTPPVRYTMQGVNCHLSCSIPPANVQLTAVSPASQPAGPNREFTVTGAALNLGTQVAIAQNGITDLTGTPVAVNAAGTKLAVAFDTSELTPGLYDLAIFGVGYTTGIASQGYLPNAYRVTPAPKPPAASHFTAVRPALVLDTTHGVGAPRARISAHATVTVKVDGRAGVPASGVTAVALTVTVIKPAVSGTVIAYPAGAARPNVTDISFAAAHNVAGKVIVGVRNGKITLYNNSAGKLDLTATVTGYYKPASGPGFFLAGPVRVLNTSTGLGGSGESVLPHAAAVTRIVNIPGIPSTITSVVLAVTVTAATRPGTLTVFPDAAAIPAHATRSFAAGHPVTTLVTVPVIDGNIDFLNNSPGTIQLTADLLGYNAP